MSLTEFTEWLAREMPPGTVISDPRWWAPRIAARFATTQPPKPAGNAIDVLLATARPFLAEELLLKLGYTWSGSGWVAPVAKPACDPCAVCKGAGSVGGLLRAPSGDPQDDYEGEVACTACDGSGINPAGAVPLPVMEVLDRRAVTPLCEHVVMGYTKAQLIAYGDAREAAGRAVAVPALIESAQQARDRVKLWFFRDTADHQRIALLKLFGLPADEVSTHGAQAHGLRHVFDALSAAPLPQQPAAEDAGREAVATAIGFDPWDRMAVEWHTRDIPPGTKLYTHPTPAADAGGVTVVDARSPKFMDWCGQWFGPDSDESYLAKAVNALPPEVRHGE